MQKSNPKTISLSSNERGNKGLWCADVNINSYNCVLMNLQTANTTSWIGLGSDSDYCSFNHT